MYVNVDEALNRKIEEELDGENSLLLDNEYLDLQIGISHVNIQYFHLAFPVCDHNIFLEGSVYLELVPSFHFISKSG